MALAVYRVIWRLGSAVGALFSGKQLSSNTRRANSQALGDHSGLPIQPMGSHDRMALVDLPGK